MTPALAHTTLSHYELTDEMYREARATVLEAFGMIPADVRSFLLEHEVTADVITEDDEVLHTLEAWSRVEMSHCEACGREVPAAMLAPVMTSAATHLSPAEYAGVCCAEHGERS